MKKFLFFVLPFAFTQISFAQFQGIIEFERIKSDTTKYSYFIKGDMVRIEETGKDGKTKGIMLIDNSKKLVTALYPERRLYMDVTNKKAATPINPEVIETGKTKKMLGYECKEWLVRSKEDDTEISYWVTDNDFGFYLDMLSTLNRKDKLPRYYLQIKGTEGMFTMEGIERTLDGKVRTHLVVTKIEDRKLRGALFEIPKGYSKFEN